MNLNFNLPWRKANDFAAAARTAQPDVQPPEAAADGPVGCGWFDSSHELHAGLLMHEHDTLDTLATELPLPTWLEWQMRAWRSACPVTQPA